MQRSCRDVSRVLASGKPGRWWEALGCSPGGLGKGRPVKSMAGHPHLRQEYWTGNQT